MGKWDHIHLLTAVGLFMFKGNEKVGFGQFLLLIKKYGVREAYHRRNNIMLDICERVEAFWNGKFYRSGTASVIYKAIQLGLPLAVFIYFENEQKEPDMAPLKVVDFLAMRRKAYARTKRVDKTV